MPRASMQSRCSAWALASSGLLSTNFLAADNACSGLPMAKCICRHIITGVTEGILHGACRAAGGCSGLAVRAGVSWEETAMGQFNKKKRGHSFAKSGLSSVPHPGIVLRSHFQHWLAADLDEGKGNLHSTRLERERLLQVLLRIALVLGRRSACGRLQACCRGKPVNRLALPASRRAHPCHVSCRLSTGVSRPKFQPLEDALRACHGSPWHAEWTLN